MNLEQALAAGGVWAFPLAAFGGVLAGLNPCCLAFYPAVTATCCSSAGVARGRLVPSRAVAFVMGTTLATTLLGVVAAIAGHAVALLGRGPRYALAFIPIVMGLHLVGWLRLPLPSSGARWYGGGALAAFAAGLFLSLLIGACGTPVLAAILSFAAYQGSIAFGAVLLFVYGLGNGLPLLFVGTSVGSIAGRFSSPAAHAILDRITGVLLVALGFYLLLRI